MNDIPSDAKRGKLGFLLVLILIAIGSILILFPAWLPNASFSTVGENGAVEMLQLFLLIISGALFFSASYHAGRLQPIFLALGLLTMTGAIGEYARPIERLLPLQSEWLIWPLFIISGWKIITNLKAFSRFWGYASKRPTAGFLLAGLIIAYVFGEMFGSTHFWKASLGEDYNPIIPKIVDAYLELLACYFIFVSSVGFCLPITKRGRGSNL